jgi:hypothetical protein
MRHAPKTLWLATLGLCLLSLRLAADEPQPPQPKTALAQVSIAPTRAEWLPLAADSKGLILTVAGPEGFYLQRELRDGETASFSALDFQDNQLADGVYAYELRAGGAPVQSGRLWVREGQFVIPATEPKPPLRNVTAQTTTVITDDLVVQGQACIGASCLATDVNGPALKIKETNNYQIKFDALNCCVPWEQAWILQANEPGVSGDFLIRTPGTIPVRIMAPAPDNSFVIFPNGNLGLGTSTPAAQLHIRGTDAGFRNRIFVENASGTTTPREMLEIRNNGGSYFILKDTSVAQRWAVATNGSNLIIDNQANAGVEYTLGPTGNMVIAGTLTQGSDRATKRDIVSVKPDEILAKVMTLPIATWNRKTDDPSVRHLGPMAQDFAAAFGLGGEDDRHIAILDMAGVSLASIQALNVRLTTALAAKDSEIETLRRESSDLARRLAAMEQLVASLTEAATPQSQPAP